MLLKVTLFIVIGLFIDYSVASLLQAGTQCVPTATVQGPCHDCVCSAEGVFHCKRRECHPVDLNAKRPKEDCQPNYLYREDTTFCVCSDEGTWRSDACQERFRFLSSKTSRFLYGLRTNVACIPDSLYIIDCNVCRCDSTAVINVTACTNRHCASGHKADSCKIGDILRLDNEICSCSDINFYIDRLCIPIQSDLVQKVTHEELSKILEVGKSWQTVGDLIKACDSEVVYSVDCNDCVCTDERLACTTKTCTLRRKIALRNDKLYDKKTDKFLALPELKSLDEICFPGKTYRYECNTCYCEKDSHPTCATMLCLQNYVLDVNALRGALSTTNLSRKYLPEIRPRDVCVEGKRYRMDCNTCICRHRALLCSKMACITFGWNLKAVRPFRKVKKATERRKSLRSDELKASDREFLMLPTLPHHAAACTPGQKYKVDCNVCLCTEQMNLFCDKKMCIDEKTTREFEAKKRSGKPCTEPSTADCILCKCLQGKTQCEAIETCKTSEELKTLSQGSTHLHRLTFDYTKEECVPNVVYKKKCNRCYCQSDKTLRCTNKMCLNHVQAMQLEEQREYLEEHEL